MLHYAITDPKYYTSTSNSLLKTLKKVLAQKRVDMVSLRDKKTDKYEELAKSFLSIQSEYPLTKFLLHTDYQLAANLGAFGVHLPSSSLDKISDAKSKGLWVIASTHSLEEATFAENEGADAITYSPIFETPGKGEPKGLEKLKEIKGKIAIKLFALGGIVTESHIDAVKDAGADGFASIRFFLK
ncbi:thiamine phosphate synthase [Hydrogenimonas thermophila]|uniref:thiamine phosphate synthase n=1 Tax=Hydrogenimonas thermophila TaxID=223786 RepID=UPI0029373D7A|nr:thiamine phosphate synthase [Hydrogenimonas thermophila]WOE68728.1 thiamine phosphate synthase [Hydrogenimonas thermophila]WOE71238.1 thiamine phosphate synthase [Hydrogenimonas thermophila]